MGDKMLDTHDRAMPWAGRPSWLQIIALVFLSFVGGAASDQYDIAIFRPVREALIAGRALWRRHEIGSSSLNAELWRPVRGQRPGIVTHDREQAYDGYTLFSTGASAEAYLIDNDGRMVHHWKRLYSDVHDASAAVRHPVPDRSINFRSVRAFPNGDLIAVYEGIGDTPWGYGMVRLDQDSNVVWKNLGNFHHTFDLLPDGGVVGLEHAIVNREPFAEARIPLPYLDGRIVWLGADGKLVRRLRIVEALYRSRYRSLLTDETEQFLARDNGDYFHLNDVNYIDAEQASALGVGKKGDVLVSMRSQRMLAIIDPEIDSVIWAQRGPWRGQHDPNILPNGHIMLFDNWGDTENAGSRILEYDPKSMAIAWQYGSMNGHHFSSPLRGSQQLLPNGNVLIVESDAGRLLEVNRNKQIVWEYFVEIRAAGGTQYPVMCDAHKYPKDWFNTMKRL